MCQIFKEIIKFLSVPTDKKVQSQNLCYLFITKTIKVLGRALRAVTFF